jgi:hypothetical protein
MPIVSVTQEVESRRIMVQFKASLGKVSKTPISNNNLGMEGCTCHPSYVGGIGRKTAVQACPR